MRVITGSARGRRLMTLEGENVRPTPERVKEGLFSIIQFQIEGRRVLDLFAGSGQLGIEALSRGAAFATFVESDREALKCIAENGARLQVNEQMKVLSMPVERAVAKLTGPYEIIYVDPPYEFEAKEVLENLVNHKLVGGIIFLEERFDPKR